jgi:DNA-binding MarR family transcriptional regulator
MYDIIRDITEIARVGTQYKIDNFAVYGLKACHASYLMEICNCPGISQDKLAQRICINKSNVARQAAVLEEDGYILRTPSQTDRRVMELYPTEKALAVLPDILQILKNWETSLMTDLTPEEIELAGKVLLRMKDKAAQWMEENNR